MPATFTTVAPPAAPTGAAIASLWKRGLAVLLDTCIVLLIAAVPLGAIWALSGEPLDFQSGLFSTPTSDASTGELARKFLEALTMLVSWGLYVGLITSRTDGWNGQTVGKRVTDLRITAPDGSAITPATAWRRVGWEALLLGGTSTVGALIDLIIGAPTGSIVVTGIASVLFVVTLAPVLQGQQRQTLYDRLAGTVVIREPKLLPNVIFAPAGVDPSQPTAGHPQPPVAVPVISQPTAEFVPVDGSTGPRPIAPRPVRAQTWAVVVTVGLLGLIGVVMTPYLDDFAESMERAEKIKDDPENKAAFAKLKRLERLGETCLKATGSPERCDEPDELGARDIVFVDAFDLSTDPVGTHAGKIGALPDGDDVIFYAFTSADRTWATIAGGGWLDRTCIERDGDLCKDVPDW